MFMLKLLQEEIALLFVSWTVLVLIEKTYV
jgi:hypothetical protein